jgi:hypothetical protein
MGMALNRRSFISLSQGAAFYGRGHSGPIFQRLEFAHTTTVPRILGKGRRGRLSGAGIGSNR